MSIIVFLGPSLPVEIAKNILNATYLPPVKMGDVYAAVQQNPSAIVIIDGLFEQTPAVWHKEILFAIYQGIPVYGGSSMGALRAAELHTLGMKGYGRIFSDYANGEIEDDDEVAVVHSFSQGQFDCHSEAMVNIRYALKQATQEGLITVDDQKTLAAIGKGLFYPDRSWQALFYHAKQLGVASSVITTVQDFVKTRQPNQKRDDTIALLTEVRRLAEQGGLVATTVNYDFEHTVFWEHLVSYFARPGGNSNASNERVRNHVRLVDKNRDSIRQRALLIFLVEQEARRINVKISDDRLALRRFRYRRGLHTQALLVQWLKEQDISKEECLAIARLELLILRMEQRYAEQIDKGFKAVLQMDGKYRETLENVASKWQKIEQTGSLHLTEETVGSQEQVLAWYRNEYQTDNQQFEDHIAELGFMSMRQFLNELYAEYLTATTTKSEAV